MTAIRFEEVSKSYEGLSVLQGFNLAVERGEMKLLLGGSGSGKSTILKLILGLIRPDEGAVFIDDANITQLSEEDLMPLRSQIGMVFQEGALFDSLTVGENVGYRLRDQKQMSDDEISHTIREVLGFVGLEGSIDKFPSELSGGMRRRVAIARAIVGNPRIMLYDEPTAGLDPITGRRICELVMRLRDLQKVTSIFVTHDLNAAFAIAREVAVADPEEGFSFHSNSGDSSSPTSLLMLESGKVVFEGSERQLRETNSQYIREFLD